MVLYGVQQLMTLQQPTPFTTIEMLSHHTYEAPIRLHCSATGRGILTLRPVGVHAFVYFIRRARELCAS